MNWPSSAAMRGSTFGSWGPLRLMDAETGDIRLLSAETVLAFFWSPDGRKIATISIPDEGGLLGEQFEVRDEKSRRVARFAPGRTTSTGGPDPPHSFHINVIDVQSGEGLRAVGDRSFPDFHHPIYPLL